MFPLSKDKVSNINIQITDVAFKNPTSYHNHVDNEKSGFCPWQNAETLLVMVMNKLLLTADAHEFPILILFLKRILMLLNMLC